MKENLKFRQVHLDFHTSEKIMDIGRNFSKEQFQRALKTGHVNSITLFSKCHHGWAYHPSKANEMHPNLNFDLLKAEIEAAHEIGVKTPVYLSAGLDEKMARRHPEWLIRNKDESTTWAKNFMEPGYHRFCFNSPYLTYLLKQIEEVCMNYDADGIFLDIVGVIPCYCQNCINTLIKDGKDPCDDENIYELAERVYANYTAKVRETVDKIRPGLPVFHNGGHIRRGRRDLAYMNSHLELESLPTGGWGYDHFPLSAAYARTLGLEFLGMTGKFHKSWGEFGGFKHPNALRYETALSVANGAKCSIGDQLHPLGEMDMVTYELIGRAYEELEKKEPWLIDAENISDVGLFTAESAQNYYKDMKFGTGQMANTGVSDSGCVRILLEGKYLFDAIDAETNFLKYKVIILPDVIRLDEHLKKKFVEFLGSGGKLLLSGLSGLDIINDEFAIDLGIEYVGESEFCPTYLRPGFDVSPLGKTAYIMYTRAQKIMNRSATEIGALENPYFNRSVFSFCSHKHTPTGMHRDGSGVVLGENFSYIAWNIFEDYATSGSLIAKKTVCYVLDELLGKDKSIETSLPAQGTVFYTNQKNRYIVHLLYASPVKRGNDVEVIEDILPLYNISLSVKIPEKAKNVYIAPQREKLQFEQRENFVYTVVPKIENHQMIVIEA